VPVRMRRRCPINGASTLNGDSNVRNIYQTNCARSRRRQINISSFDERTPIVDPNDDAPVVTDLYLCAEGRSAVGRSQRGAIHVFAICGRGAAMPIRAAVNACDLGTPTAGIETCKEARNKEQQIPLRVAER
jgi:hypothetical protein